MSIDQEKMIVEALPSLYPLKNFEEEAIHAVLNAIPKWNPVTENTLPKDGKVVVVCGEKGTWDYGMYRGHTPSNIHLWEWKQHTLKRVYWWMYKEDALPEPYKPTVPPECEGDCGWCKPTVIEKCKGVTE